MVNTLLLSFNSARIRFEGSVGSPLVKNIPNIITDTICDKDDNNTLITIPLAVSLQNRYCLKFYPKVVTIYQGFILQEPYDTRYPKLTVQATLLTPIAGDPQSPYYNDYYPRIYYTTMSFIGTIVNDRGSNVVSQRIFFIQAIIYNYRKSLFKAESTDTLLTVTVIVAYYLPKKGKFTSQKKTPKVGRLIYITSEFISFYKFLNYKYLFLDISEANLIVGTPSGTAATKLTGNTPAKRKRKAISLTYSLR